MNEWIRNIWVLLIGGVCIYLGKISLVDVSDMMTAVGVISVMTYFALSLLGVKSPSANDDDLLINEGLN